MSFLAGWIALGTGLLNLLGRKGTPGHRAIGLLFVLSMCLVAVVAASRVAVIGLDLFALAALASVAVTLWAVLPFVRRRPGWVERHATRMQAATIALGAAAGNEIVTTEVVRRAPGVPLWPAEAAVTLLVALVGSWLALRQRAEIRRIAERYRVKTAPRPTRRD